MRFLSPRNGTSKKWTRLVTRTWQSSGFARINLLTPHQEVNLLELSFSAWAVR